MFEKFAGGGKDGVEGVTEAVVRDRGAREREGRHFPCMSLALMVLGWPMKVAESCGR